MKFVVGVIRRILKDIICVTVTLFLFLPLVWDGNGGGWIFVVVVVVAKDNDETNDIARRKARTHPTDHNKQEADEAYQLNHWH